VERDLDAGEIEITIMASDVADERIAVATRDLLRDIRVDVDPRARLVEHDGGPGAKGVAVTLGQIALALVTGGAVSKLIENLFAFLARNRRLGIELQNAAGEKLKLDMEFVDDYGTDKALTLAAEFLKKARE
jgi:hypothetical protein